VQHSLFGALTFARLDSRERLVAAVLLPGPLSEMAIVQKLRSDQEESKTRRAIKRLVRDSLIAVAQGLLSLTKWWTWPPHRLDPKHAQQLDPSGASTGPQDGNSPAVVDDRVVPAADPPMGTGPQSAWRRSRAGPGSCSVKMLLQRFSTMARAF
jgi:hypothetical protein